MSDAHLNSLPEKNETIGPETKPLRVATWNMDHWKRTAQQRRDSWDYLESGEFSDIALLQECLIPKEFRRERYEFREIGGVRPRGTAVVNLDKELSVEEIGTVKTRYSSSRFSMLGTYPGTIMVTQVEIPDMDPITCISVYGMIEVYSQTTMLRIIADLIPLFDSSFGNRVILGGDLNISTAFNPNSRDWPRYKAILEMLEALGLVNLASAAEEPPATIDGCICGQDSCNHLHTYGSDPGSQLDWLYGSPVLARHCRSIRADRKVVGTLSDHAPVVANFDLPLGKTEWDQASFFREIGVRHGTTIQQLVEEIVAWAERRTEEFRRQRITVALDRFPFTGETEPVIWLQVDLENQLGSQYTFALSAAGFITIPFQYFFQPYETTEAREKLWSRITEIPGINLEKRLNGRPTFSLKALETQGNLNHFLQIFDELVDRTVEHRRELTTQIEQIAVLNPEEKPQ